MSQFGEIETPAVLIELERVEQNVLRLQSHCDRHGIALRPHIKTHKLPRLARLQIEAGAIGITCQKIGEAEVMADAGIDNILITYNILGDSKLQRLLRLSRRCRLSVVADNAVVVEGLAGAFVGEAQPLNVLVECDTGAGRCGTQSIEQTLGLAQLIHNAEGLALAGLMTYPPMGDQGRVNAWLQGARDALLGKRLPCPVVSSGGTPNMWRAQEVPTATEHRAGTYIYNDRSLVRAEVCSVDDCALSVMATVVSRPTAERAIIDAGSKILTSDLLGMEGHGLIASAPKAKVAGLSEEHGTIDLTNSPWNPRVGERLRIIPNHACVVSNMVDRVYLLRGGEIECEERVAARGRVT